MFTWNLYEHVVQVYLIGHWLPAIAPARKY
jgi:hypothetical protein